MSWFTNLFSSNKNTSRNSRTISSTHEAFSLPMSSPSHPGEPYNLGTPSTPEPPSAATSTYSYPPSSPTSAYDYVPAATGSRSSRKSTLLPTYGGGAPYPPLAQTWARLRQWLGNEYPELGDTLNWGILPQDLAQTEMALGIQLPTAVRDSFLCADGQEAESAAGCSDGLFFGLTLLPLEDVLEEWRFWREVDDDPTTGANTRLKDLMDSIPSGWIRKEYSCRGWVPLIADKAGNYLGVDMNPGEDGQVGQVIVFGRDFDTKVVMHRGQGYHGWATWLAGFVDDLESGEGYEMGTSNDASEGSEDSVGYESYFFDGVGRGLGDGGGDTGSGGLRLAGEYKGWNVFEAWADRSVRKWQEQGLVPAFEEAPSKPRAADRLPDETVKAVSGMGTGAEVPIPITKGEAGEPSSSTTQPLANVTNRESISQRPLPTISVTKPPIPMPLSLPTADDVVVAMEIASAPPSHTDLEAGGGMMMREIEAPLPPSKSHTAQMSSSTCTVRPAASFATVPTIPPPPASPTAPPASPAPTPLSSATSLSSPAPPVTPATQQPDLLTDSPALRAKSPPPLPEATFSVQSEDSPVLIGSDDARPPSLDINLSNSSAEGSLSNDGVLVSDPEPDGPVEKAAAEGLEKLAISAESAGTTNPVSKP